MNLLDLLLPPAREFRWALLLTLPPLAYPVKPYRSVSISQRTVIDATGQLWHFTVDTGRITKWSNQFSTYREVATVNFWHTLTPAQRLRITLRWEAKKLHLFRALLLAQRELHLRIGFPWLTKNPK